MSQVLWSEWDDAIATNYDGTYPGVTLENTVFVKELGCICCPEGCGGCIDIWNEYEIKDGGRYFWKTI